jgi:hypothetical protein
MDAWIPLCDSSPKTEITWSELRRKICFWWLTLIAFFYHDICKITSDYLNVFIGNLNKS